MSSQVGPFLEFLQALVALKRLLLLVHISNVSIQARSAGKLHIATFEVTSNGFLFDLHIFFHKELSFHLQKTFPPSLPFVDDQCFQNMSASRPCLRLLAALKFCANKNVKNLPS